MPGFEWLNHNAWVPFASVAVALFCGAITLVFHTIESKSRKYVYVLFVALMIGFVGFVLGGIQAGDNPIMPREQIVPYIRISFFLSGMIVNAFLVMYWALRFRVMTKG